MTVATTAHVRNAADASRARARAAISQSIRPGLVFIFLGVLSGWKGVWARGPPL